VQSKKRKEIKTLSKQKKTPVQKKRAIIAVASLFYNKQ